MNPLLLSGFGISAYVEKRRLVIENRFNKERLEFYPHQIDHDSVIIDGHAGNITFEAIRWLMKHDISITLMNWDGTILGVTLPKEPKAGKLKIAQYRAYLDSAKRTKIANEIVSQKIAHSYNLLKELARYYDEVDVNEAEKVFAAEKNNLTEEEHSIARLMNYEGRIAMYYWGVLARVFTKLCPQFRFARRRSESYSWNMNASDEINALLNYGYAILESEVRKAINSTGLDPTIGFLHEVAPSKEPLVYDIQELFRWLIDLSIIQLLEERTLKKSDFITTENYQIRLRESAAKVLMEKISLNFNTKAANYKGNKSFAYQNILSDIVQQLANFSLGKKPDLLLGLPCFRIGRSDSMEIRRQIMSISPRKRKELGINKSTLWYQKKKLVEGRNFKVYSKVLSKLR